MNALKIIGLSLFLVVAAGARAVEVTGLYQAEVPVADHGNPARQAAMVDALGQVLLKLGGEAALKRRGQLTADAAGLAQEYRYREQPAGQGQSALLLWARFDPAAVDQRLRNAGIPAWGAARPVVLTWLATEEQGARTLLGAHDESPILESLLREADRRAVPVRLPLMDLADQSKIKVADLWAGAYQPVLDASARYEPQAVLIGRVGPLDASRWRAAWDLSLGDEHWQWTTEGNGSAEAVAAGIGEMAQRLAQRFSQSAGNGLEHLRLTVHEVRDMNDFRRLTDYLGTLGGVTGVQLESLGGTGTAILTLDVEGGAEVVVQTLALGDTLVREEGATAGAPGADVLAYRLRK